MDVGSDTVSIPVPLGAEDVFTGCRSTIDLTEPTEPTKPATLRMTNHGLYIMSSDRKDEIQRALNDLRKKHGDKYAFKLKNFAVKIISVDSAGHVTKWEKVYGHSIWRKTQKRSI